MNKKFIVAIIIYTFSFNVYPNLHPKITKQMSTYDNEVDGIEDFLWSVRLGDLESIQDRISKGHDINKASFLTKKTALHVATNVCQANIIELLLANSADVHSKDALGNTPLHYAAKVNCIAGIKYLLEANADLHLTNNSGETPSQLIEING